MEQEHVAKAEAADKAHQEGKMRQLKSEYNQLTIIQRLPRWNKNMLQRLKQRQKPLRKVGREAYKSEWCQQLTVS